MNLRPLYLEAGTGWRIKLDDGVALNVSAEGRARSLYPLQRLARVVCGSTTEWDTAALLACLRAGVPVLFHDAHGDTLGWCFGPRRRETTLAALLGEGLRQPGWDDFFNQWRQAAEGREVLAALRFMQGCSARLDAAAVRAYLCNLHRDRFGLPVGPWLRALERAAAALAAESLHSALGDPALVCFARPGLHLAQEFAALLEWRLHCLLHETPGTWLLQTPPGRAGAAIIERRTADVQAGCGELLGDLEQQLRGWLL
jgi:hypothetical protein